MILKKFNAQSITVKLRHFMKIIFHNTPRSHNSNGDLFCSIEKRNQTCSILPNEKTGLSNLDINAAIYIYGKDGFGGFNRVLVNKTYYIEPIIGRDSIQE
jgi:hypothetical protein